MQQRFDKVLNSLEMRLPGPPASGESPRFLLAVSGGIDSMCLSELFLHASGCPAFAVAHCNFHLRGIDSDADEAFVRAWAEGHDIEYYGIGFDTRAYASAKGLSVEMAARELRYTWFADLCRAQGFAAVAVAHNRNDNAETLVLNLLRGTGLQGLTGMKELSVLPVPSVRGLDPVPLIRPLLGFTREEIQEYAVSGGLSWREDRTNADSTFKRNRVRNEIFPLFAQINPSYLDALDRDMRHLRQVQAIADDFADALRDDLLVPDGESGARIDIRRLLAEKHWKYALYRLLEPYSFSLSDLGDLCRLLREGETRSGKIFRSKDGILITTARELVVSRPPESVPENDELVVEGPGDYSLLGVSFRISVEAGKPGIALKQPVGTLIFDSGKLPFPFTVRKWREGDWIRPLGLRAASGRPGRKKLSDLFVDLKFGLPEKEKALVVAGEGSHVHALLGLRIDESVKVSESTASVTRIRITGCR